MVATKEIDHATELDFMLTRMQDMVIDCKALFRVYKAY